MASQGVSAQGQKKKKALRAFPPLSAEDGREEEEEA